MAGGALTQTSAKCSANVCYRRGVWRSRPATSGAVVVMLFEKVKMFAGYDKPGDLSFQSMPAESGLSARPLSWRPDTSPPATDTERRRSVRIEAPAQQPPRHTAGRAGEAAAAPAGACPAGLAGACPAGPAGACPARLCSAGLRSAGSGPGARCQARLRGAPPAVHLEPSAPQQE